MVDSATRRAFQSLIAAACVDGKLADAERELLTGKARELGIPLPELDNYLREGLAGKFTVSVPPTPLGKQALLDDMINVVCADGRVESQEKQLLLRFASHIGMEASLVGQRVRDRLNRAPNDVPPPEKTGRVDHPQPIKFIDESAARKVGEPVPSRAEGRPKPLDSPLPARAPPEEPRVPGGSRDSLMTVAPGPLKLHSPAVSTTLPAVTLELVKNVIRFDGRDEAVDYVVRTCGIRDINEARRIVDKIIAETPDCKPGSLKVKHGR